MGASRRGEADGERVVLLQLQGPQVRDGVAHEPRHQDRLLEGHRQGPGGAQPRHARRRRHEEDARLLPGTRPQRRQDQLGHARVPPRLAAPAAKGGLGAVQGVPEAEGGRRAGQRPLLLADLRRLLPGSAGSAPRHGRKQRAAGLHAAAGGGDLWLEPAGHERGDVAAVQLGSSRPVPAGGDGGQLAGDGARGQRRRRRRVRVLPRLGLRGYGELRGHEVPAWVELMPVVRTRGDRCAL